MVSFEVTSIEQPRTATTCRVDHPRRARGGLPYLLRPAAHHLLLLGAGAGLLRGPGDRGSSARQQLTPGVCAGDGLPGVPRVRLRRQPPRPHLQPPLPQRHALQPAVLRVRLVVQRGLQRGECGTILHWLLTLRRP